jgi:SAM-dependent methyltransferase
MSDISDYDALASRLRDLVLEQKSSLSRYGESGAAPMADSSELAKLLALVHDRQDIAKAQFRSHRLLLGRAIVALRKLFRDALHPIFAQQAEFNSASADLASTLALKLLETERSSMELRERANRLEADFSRRLKAVQNELDSRASTIRDLQQASQALRDELASQVESLSASSEQVTSGREPQTQPLFEDRLRVARLERRVRRLIYELNHLNLSFTVPPDVAPPRPRPNAHESSEGAVTFDYAGFEERVRGSEQQLKTKQRDHLKFFAGADDVLDFGCGRGEFLELLRKANINAHGVDLSLDMVLLCQEKGLAVTRNDGLNYLRQTPNDSLGGIYSSQVIEHLSAQQVLEFIDLAHEKLKAKGVLLIETLNPESLFVLYRWFWMDPTHIRLVHPQTLAYGLECSGFRDIKTEYTTLPDVPRLPSFADASALEGLGALQTWTSFVNQLLFSAQDYAVIAEK